MKQTNIELPDQLHSLLRREAQRRGMTPSELAREAISHHLGAGVARGPGSDEPGHGGRHLAGERIEEVIGQVPDDPDSTKHHVAERISEVRRPDHDR